MKIKTTTIDLYFGLSAAGTTLRTELVAGITTFMTMAYILAVNPAILGDAGMDRAALFTATAVSSALATLFMALVAKLPFALAPGMGINAFFAYTVVIGMGHSWQTALTAVFLEGLLFVLLTALNVRGLIINAIPQPLRHAVSAGIGLFIAFIGLQNSGIIVESPSVLLTMGNIKSPSVLIAMGGLILTAVLLVRKVKGALLFGMLIATVIGIPFGITQVPHGNLLSLPPSIAPVFFKFDFKSILSGDILVVIFTFLFVDMFDTVGTLVGICDKADMFDEKGNIPRVKQALFADSLGTMAGALLGTSPVTTYVESAAGIAEGGKTGLTSLTVAILFLLSLFLAPVFMMVPSAATAPALIIVGFFMMSPFQKIRFDEISEALPAFVTLVMLPLTYSIADGIVFGILSYVLIKLLSGKVREVSPVTIILALLFAAKLAL
ncbi:MAG TPA: guanine permease [Verrucomicrobia bacterium]|nr:guanine permease [Verrucomicrobiota bacterium]